MSTFTEEEKNVVWMAQIVEEDRIHIKTGRIPCIKKIIEFIVGESDPEVRRVMNQARRKLAFMSDAEYAAYDFRTEDSAP